MYFFGLNVDFQTFSRVSASLQSMQCLKKQTRPKGKSFLPLENIPTRWSLTVFGVVLLGMKTSPASASAKSELVRPSRPLSLLPALLPLPPWSTDFRKSRTSLLWLSWPLGLRQMEPVLDDWLPERTELCLRFLVLLRRTLPTRALLEALLFKGCSEKLEKFKNLKMLLLNRVSRWLREKVYTFSKICAPWAGIIFQPLCWNGESEREITPALPGPRS